MKAVDDCFERPDVAILRLGYINRGSAYSSARLYVGKDIEPQIKALHEKTGFVIPRTAGNLLLTYMRLKLLPEFERNSDPVTRLGRATVSGEHVDGLVIIAINHADNRYDDRRGCANIISLVAPSRGEGFIHLNEVAGEMIHDPTSFVETLHSHLGDGLPRELQIIGSFAVYNSTQGLYLPKQPRT